MSWYNLNHEPVDFIEASELLGNTDARRVAHDYVGDIWVSTVFLVLDHNLGQSSSLFLYETMMFTEENKEAGEYWAEEIEFPWREEYQWRHTTRESAIIFHTTLVNMLRSHQLQLMPGGTNEG